MKKAKFGPPILKTVDDKVDIDEVNIARVTQSMQEDSRIPDAPTRGWMLRELELIGTHLRGTSLNDAALAKLLRLRGYQVHISKTEKKVEDR